MAFLSGSCHETHLPAFRRSPQAYARLSRPHGDQSRSRRTERPSPQGTCPPRGLRRNAPEGVPGSLSAGTRWAGVRHPMLASRHRLRGERAFREVMSSGRRWSTADATIHAMRVSPAEGSLLGLVVGRKALKRAVDRNAFKRRIRGAFRDQLSAIEGLHVVVRLRNKPTDDSQSGRHSGPRLAAESVSRRFEDVARWFASASS